MSNPNWGQQPPQGHPPQGQPPQGQPPQGYGPPPQQYGQPYGPPPQQYGPQGPYGQPPRGGSGKKGLFAALGVVVVAGAVVLTLFLTGVFGSDSDGGSPADAARAVAEATKNNDLDAIKANLCKADVDRFSSRYRPGGKSNLASYSIGSTTTVDDTHAKVQITSRNIGSSNDRTEQIPVVKEDGDWKVCFSDALGSSGTAATTAQPSVGSSDGGGNVQIPQPGSTYTLPNGSSIVIPSIPAGSSYTP